MMAPAAPIAFRIVAFLFRKYLEHYMSTQNTALLAQLDGVKALLAVTAANLAKYQQQNDQLLQADATNKTELAARAASITSLQAQVQTLQGQIASGASDPGGLTAAELAAASSKIADEISQPLADLNATFNPAQ